MNRVTLFVDVIVPVRIEGAFTYRVPATMNEAVAVGKRVVVHFGRSKVYTGLIRKVHEDPPRVYKAKYIDLVLDDVPVVPEDVFPFWEWIARYYLCTIGEVMNAALPSGLKLDAAQKVVFHPDYEKNFKDLSDKEYLLVEAIDIQTAVKMIDIPAIIGVKTVQPIVKSLIERRIIIIQDELRNRYKPKLEAFVSLNERFHTEDVLSGLLDKLQSKKQLSAQLNQMLGFIYLTEENYQAKIRKKDLLNFTKTSVSPLQTLIKKGIFIEEKLEINRIENYEGEEMTDKKLTEDQDHALDEIKEGFSLNKPVVLHGVTSSGKTEVYVSLIREYINQGQQVLFMLPEIALTTQLISRLQKYFGDRIGIFHSKFSQNERVEVWQRTLSEKDDRFDVLIGARSSVFLPFRDLGLIIIDEEHENTFKQFDPAPRYNARDAALVLAHQHQSQVLMGSATPSIESYYYVKGNKYHLVEMHRRFGNIQMPEIFCADLKQEQRQKTMRSHFSSFLLKEMEEVLEAKEQVILFQNRRGYTPLWVCEDCGWVPQCQRCDVSLTYHKRAHLLSCHYCGYAIHPPKQCEACKSAKLEMKGFGTEKIEDELQILYPDLKIGRLDYDTTRSRHGYNKILEGFGAGELDVLIGTQMVSKGLDFDNVSLVGILNADQMLNYPDFRAYERSYQLMSQVAGRSGRSKKRGKVIIQTYNPDHWIIRQVIDNNYTGMYNQEIYERKSYNYPPFYRLIEFTVKHKDKDQCRFCAEVLTQKLRDVFKNRVLGPEDPSVARVNNYHLKQTLLKMEKELSVWKSRDIIREIIKDLRQTKDFRSARIVINADPV